MEKEKETYCDECTHFLGVDAGCNFRGFEPEEGYPEKCRNFRPDDDDEEE